MSDVSQQIIDDVLAACKTGAEESAASIARTFDEKLQLSVGAHGTLQSQTATLGLNRPGLLIVLKTDRATVVLTLPADNGLVPDWCVQPDTSGESRLATLAQELGMNLLPETWLTHDFQARWIPSLADALARGNVSPDATAISLEVCREDQATETLGLIWPVTTPEGLFAVEPPSAGPKTLIGKSNLKGRPTLALNSSDLPPFTRSLLRIKVPVVVTLAEKRQKLSRIVELGPGSIIQFDKSCEEMLDLEVGNRPVACGEAVKVGDKFGLRITAISLPDERFNPVKPQPSSGAAC